MTEIYTPDMSTAYMQTYNISDHAEMEQLEFGLKDLFNWGKKAAGWAGRTARNVAKKVLKIPDYIKRLIKAVIGKRNKAIRKYHKIRKINPRYARIYYRKLQALERKYKYLIKGSGQQEGLEWLQVLIVAGIAVGGAVVGWIMRGHFGTAKTELNRLIQEYDRLIAEADSILQRRAANDPQYAAWRSKVSKTRNTALTTVAAASPSLTDQLVDVAKFGILAYAGFKIWEAIQKKRG